MEGGMRRDGKGLWNFACTVIIPRIFWEFILVVPRTILTSPPTYLLTGNPKNLRGGHPLKYHLADFISPVPKRVRFFLVKSKPITNLACQICRVSIYIYWPTVLSHLADYRAYTKKGRSGLRSTNLCERLYGHWARK